MDKPLISIILATMRPSQLVACLASIHRYTADVNYEVVVISPYQIDAHPNVFHVKEDRPEGMYKAVAMGYEKARGEYLIQIADDSRATPLWVSNMIKFMKPHDGEIFEGNFRHFNVLGERPEPGYYGKLIAPFFCIRKDKADRIGGLMDCYLRSFRGDSDLSLRVWHNGGRVETCPDAWVYYPDYADKVHENSHNKYFELDKEAFIKRWHPLLAKPDEEFVGAKPVSDTTITPDLPPEVTTTLCISIKNHDWKTVKNILSANRNDVCVYPEGFSTLYQLVLEKIQAPFTPQKLLKDVLRWLWQKGYTPEAEPAFSKGKKGPLIEMILIPIRAIRTRRFISSLYPELKKLARRID
jgi:GT2 family glycosyltransferase